MTGGFPYLDCLNKPQREAVLHTGEPLLILAGAGSGKTRVITTKIAYLTDSGHYDPRSILAVTFTNRAAKEMAERAASLSRSGHGAMVRTFHSFGAWFLRRNAGLAGLVPSFSIYDDEDSLSLLRGLNPNRTEKDLRPYARAIARAKDSALSPEDLLLNPSAGPFATGLPGFDRIYAEYEAKLRAIGNVDFGDLILLPLRILKENGEVRERTRARFSCILVDEYQDSNVAQYELLKTLTCPETYLCVVGDDDQSIYRFRGAEVRNILDFPRQFPGTRIIRLEENYRSTPQILQIAHAVVSNNTGRLGKELWTSLPKGEKGTLILCDDHEEEALQCVRILEDGDWANTAILYRTNAQSLPFETAFTRHRIPYRVVGALRFYEREEVKDVLALLGLILNHRDEVSFKRMVNKPARGIGKTSIERVIAAADSADPDLIRSLRLTSPDLPAKGREGASRFLALLDWCHKSLGRLPLGDFVHALIERSGLAEYHKEQDASEGGRKAGNLEQLVNAAAEYQPGMEGLAAFMENITLDRSLSDGEDDSGRVTLITVHNTKGLEFDRVIMTGLEEGIFPSGMEEDTEEIEEERRLFYVGVTRAKRSLFLTSCRRRLRWGRIANLRPSRFLLEIPREYLTVKGDFPSPERDRYPLGSGVYHQDYGPGTVVARNYVSGRLSIQVRFASGMIGRFLPDFQPLERIHGDD